VGGGRFGRNRRDFGEKIRPARLRVAKKVMNTRDQLSTVPVVAQRQVKFLPVAVLALSLLSPGSGALRQKIVRIPFREAESMILIDGKVNGQSAVFLVDTGCKRTVVTEDAFGSFKFELQRMRHNDTGPGLRGQAVRLPADVEIGTRQWPHQAVSVMNFAGIRQTTGVSFDGLLGQDLLRDFRSVRIDYSARVIELEN